MQEQRTGLKLKLEIDLESDATASVGDVTEAIRGLADRLLAECGEDCEMSQKCGRCWNRLSLTDASGKAIGVGTIVWE